MTMKSDKRIRESYEGMKRREKQFCRKCGRKLSNKVEYDEYDGSPIVVGKFCSFCNHTYYFEVG